MLKSHLKPYLKEMIVGPVFKLIEAIFELMIPLLMAKAIDEGMKSGDMSLVIRYIIMMLILTILGFVSAITCQYFAGVAGYGAGEKLRKTVFSHIIHLDDEQFDLNSKQFLINNVTADAEQIQNTVNMLIRLASRAPFLIVGAIVLAFFIHVKIAIIFLIISVTVLLFILLLGKRTVKFYRVSQENLDTLARLTKESKTGDKMIRAFSKQNETKMKFDQESDDYKKILNRIGRINSFLNPVNYLLINLGILIVLYFGGKYVHQGIISQGQILALVNYFGQILASLFLLVNLVTLLTRAISSYDRIKYVLELKTSLKIEQSPSIITNALLVVDRVSFAFPNQPPVLKNISFSILENSSLGVVGRTGSGKSTLMKLLLRSYDPNEGEIYFKGKNLKSISPKTILESFEMAYQKSYLFEGTVKSNLLMANHNLTEEEMKILLLHAQSKFVLEHEDGLEMKIMQGGLNLSGGQRQRLNIARALASYPKLLILDDSSSALDFKTDFELRQSLRELKMTTIVVTQRIPSIQHCDQIIVIEKGEIVGIGTHKELMKENEIYQLIADSQGVVI